jgi:hypothetical protein
MPKSKQKAFMMFKAIFFFDCISKETEDKINPDYGQQVEYFTNVDFTSIAANIINLNLLRSVVLITFCNYATVCTVRLPS